MVFNATLNTFSYIIAVIFIGGGNQSTRRKKATDLSQIVKIDTKKYVFLRGIQKVRITIPLLSFAKLSKLTQKISIFLRGIQKVGITIHLLSFDKLSNLT
jgi:hypothetical protein